MAFAKIIQDLLIDEFVFAFRRHSIKLTSPGMLLLTTKPALSSLARRACSTRFLSSISVCRQYQRMMRPCSIETQANPKSGRTGNHRGRTRKGKCFALKQYKPVMARMSMCGVSGGLVSRGGRYGQ